MSFNAAKASAGVAFAASATSTTTVTGPAGAGTVCAELGVTASAERDSAAAQRWTKCLNMIPSYFLIVTSS
jgi:hypothetical protein